MVTTVSDRPPVKKSASSADVSNLSPQHAEYLRARGLSEETIRIAGIRTVWPGDLNKLAGREAPDGTTGMLIPYPGADGFGRVRLFPPIPTADGKSQKFGQAKGSGVRAYIPPAVRAVLDRSETSIFITEGEVKALSLTQHCFLCIGLGGVWNFRSKDLPEDGLIPDLDGVGWKGRIVHLIPDSDAWTKDEVLLAVYTLARILEKRGAMVFIVKLPDLDGKKLGADDFLVKKGPAAFRRLVEKAVTLRHPAFRPPREREKRRAREVVKDAIPSNVTPVPPGPPPRLAGVVDEIAGLVLRYVKLPHDDLAALVALWIVNTYTFARFNYCGYLALRSATPRCGKSRLLRLAALFSNSNPPVTANPSAAALFRSGRPVLVLDEVDRLRNADKETFGDVLAVLNFGFERGGVVERVEKGKDGFAVKSFQVYGPKALAGIEALADTLSDRAFQIEMQRTPKRMTRLNARRLEPTAEKVRGRLAAWAAANGDACAEAYDGLPDEVPNLAGLDDRLQDISEPLLVLAAMADAERPEGPLVFSRLLEGLKAAGGRREPSNRETEFGAILEIVRSRLKGAQGAQEIFISSGELVSECQSREDLSRIENGRFLANLLKRFDLSPGHSEDRKSRGYTIRREWVEEWETRYPKPPKDTAGTLQGAGHV